GEAIEAALADSDLQLGDGIRQSDGTGRLGAHLHSPTSSHMQSMAKQTTERVKLYSTQFDVRDDEPDDEEIREVVKAGLKNGRASGTSQLCAEDVKGWLRGMEDEEDSEKRAEGAGDQWPNLIPKGSSGDYRGIRLLEPFWKVIEGIMDTRLGGVIEFHPSLHGFVKGRGCGTAGIETKLAQQLAYLKQRPLYGVFIDLRNNAYDTMDRDRCMYGVGPNMLRLIRTF
ncbi:hypothetical protein THAOC_23883, partial [Thalassiosira oceanica]